MAIRTITWTVGEDMRVSPTNHQHAGVQGDDKATTAVFVLPEKLCAGYDVCAEFVNALGEHDQTEVLQIEEGKVSFPLPLAWTQEGGRATIRLVVTARGDAEETAYTFEGKVVFEGRSTAFAKVKGVLEGAIQRLLSVCAKSVEKVEAAGEAAENFMENLPDFEAGKSCYSVFEKNKQVPISLWVGTCAEYDALPVKPNNTIVIKLDREEPDETYRLTKRKAIDGQTNVLKLEAGNYTVQTAGVAKALWEKGYWPFKNKEGTLTVKYPLRSEGELNSDADWVVFEAESRYGERMINYLDRSIGGSFSSYHWKYADAMEDRLVKRGEENGWKYRKWESGDVELWCITQVATEIEKQVGADYYSKQIKVPLPFTVYNPVLTGTATNYFTICNGSPYDDNASIGFRVKRTASGDTAETTVRLRIDGEWIQPEEGGLPGGSDQY